MVGFESTLPLATWSRVLCTPLKSRQYETSKSSRVGCAHHNLGEGSAMGGQSPPYSTREKNRPGTGFLLMANEGNCTDSSNYSRAEGRSRAADEILARMSGENRLASPKRIFRKLPVFC